ncbi:MAG: carbonic anhydrase [Bacteroidia bacterium]|nr:carbonic anhydrase [Bacteroidia bacterium]MCZ2248242.1 carbonic anhydrase [Bacteroidia bacterium]
MDEYQKLLELNKLWAADMVNKDPDFFTKLVNTQKPQFLWIGCSDSRVPANEITNTQPGEIFVQRNIANLVVNTDLNMLSVLKYAVEVLVVKHIIVTGHYGCGGVRAALTNNNYGLLNKWLSQIKDVYRLHAKELNAITNEQLRLDRLVELNAIEQVNNLAKTSIVQKAWKRNSGLKLHACVYSLQNGVMNHLKTIDSSSPMDKIFRFNFDSEMED